MAKGQRQINHMFHPIDKDMRLLSVDNDIEVLIAQVLNASNFLIFEHFNDFFLSFRPFEPIISKKRLHYLKKLKNYHTCHQPTILMSHRPWSIWGHWF